MSIEKDLLGRFRKGGVLFDGAMGSMLIAEGLPSGASPEEWNRSRPATIRRIHESYLEAGADFITTNTFGATPSRLESFGLGDELRVLNNTAVRLAREAISEFADAETQKGTGRGAKESTEPRAGDKFIALSLGPTGKMLPPVGNSTEEAIKREYTGQIGSIEEAFDLILIETIFDVREGILALEAAKSLVSVPVAVTLTYTRNPIGFFTIMGDAPEATMERLEAAGADIVGANCSISSGDMLELAAVLRESTELPILCQPNAGSPEMKNGVPVYNQRPSEFAGDAIRIFEKGIQAVGGCCGTTPEFIREAYTRMRSR